MLRAAAFDPTRLRIRSQTVRVARGRDWIRRLLPALLVGWLLAGGSITTGHAFTLIAATSLTVSPTQGMASAAFTAEATYRGTLCQQQAPLTFNIYWVSDVPAHLLWSRQVTTCNANTLTYDTGSSPPVKPIGSPAPGPHTVSVDVISPTGGLAPNGTGSATYTILAPPPSPPRSHRPSPTPSSSPSPIPTAAPCYSEGHTRACPSPSAVDCTHPPTAALPPSSGGATAALIFGGVLAGGLPLGAAAMVMFPGFRFRRNRLSRLAALVGLGCLLIASTECVFRPSGQTAASPTPLAAANSVIGFEVTPDCRGYWMAGSDGAIYPFGAAAGFGSAGGLKLIEPIVDLEATPDGGGYWLVSADGGIFPFGDAAGFGSTGGIKLNKPIVAMENTPDGGGYWLVASDGGIFPFGDAVGYGSTGSIHLNQPIVDMEATPDGAGYWLVAADGGIFPFGDAGGFGSTGRVHLNKPIVGMEATPGGGGYWLVASDGGVFPFGDAAGYGSTGGVSLSSPIVGMEATPDGHGYWLFAADGGVFPFGDAPGLGSAAGHI